MLTAERLRELLSYDPETGVFVRLITAGGQTAGTTPKSKNTNGRIQFKVDRGFYLAHRLAWLYVYGVWPVGVLDHKNRDFLDNRIDNLRDVSNAESVQNKGRYKNNKSGYQGVHWCWRSKAWLASIQTNGYQRVVGRAKTAAEAHAFYLKAKLEEHPFYELEGKT